MRCGGIAISTPPTRSALRSNRRLRTPTGRGHLVATRHSQPLRSRRGRTRRHSRRVSTAPSRWIAATRVWYVQYAGFQRLGGDDNSELWRQLLREIERISAAPVPRPPRLPLRILPQMLGGNLGGTSWPSYVGWKHNFIVPKACQSSYEGVHPARGAWCITISGTA